MQAIFDFFASIGETVVNLVDFFIGTIQDIVYMVGLLGSVVSQLPVMFSWLPGACVTLLVTVFGIVVVYKIIGREG